MKVRSHQEETRYWSISIYNSLCYVRNRFKKQPLLLELFYKIWHLLKVLFTCTVLANAVDLFTQRVRRMIPKGCKNME